MKTTLIVLHVIRVHNLCLGILAVYVSSFLLEVDFNLDVFWCMSAVCSVMALGYLMNDCLDIKSDKINHPKRVIVNHKIGYFQLLIIGLFFLIVLFFSSISINKEAQNYLFFIVIPLLVCYNFFLKKIPLLGNFSVSFLLGFVFLFTEKTLLNSFNNLLIPFYLTVCFSFLRELIKDAEDKDGDNASKMWTIPIILGEKKTRLFIILVTIILLLLLPSPYFFKIYTIKYFLSLILFIEIPLIYSLFLLIKFPSKRTYTFLVKLLKFLCLAGLIVFIIEKQ